MEQTLLLVSVVVALFVIFTKSGQKVVKDVSKSVSSLTKNSKSGFPVVLVIVIVLGGLMCLSRKQLMEGSDNDDYSKCHFPGWDKTECNGEWSQKAWEDLRNKMDRLEVAWPDGCPTTPPKKSQIGSIQMSGTKLVNKPYTCDDIFRDPKACPDGCPSSSTVPNYTSSEEEIVKKFQRDRDAEIEKTHGDKSEYAGPLVSDLNNQ